MEELSKGLDFVSLHREFVASVEVDEYQQSLEFRRLLSGENSFKVWREHFCEQKHVVAEILDITDVDYVLIEEGEIEPTPEDIVRFSQYFDIHPIDMCVQRPLSSEMVKALLMVHSDPDLLGKSQSNTKAREVLETIVAASSFSNLESECQLLDKNSPVKSALIIRFIDSVLRADGQMMVEPLDIFDYASILREIHQDEARFTKDRFERLTKEWTSHSQSYHKLGWALFGEDWKRINAKLFEAMRRSSLDDGMIMYMNDPSFVGLKEFPENTTSISYKNKLWREAQREHFKYVELTFLAASERLKAQSNLEIFSKQIDEFDRWVHQNVDTLHEYDNRQLVLAHADFSYARKAYTPISNPKVRRFTL